MADVKISRLGVVMALNSAEFNAGIDKAGKKLTDFKSQAKDTSKGLVDLALSFNGLSTLGLGAAIAGAISYASEMKDVSEATGTTLAYTNKFADALQKSGGDAKNTAKILNTLASSLSDAQNNLGPERVALLAAGLTDADIAAGNTADTIKKLVDSLSKLDRIQQIKVLKDLGLQKLLGSAGFADLKDELAGSTEGFEQLARAQEAVDQAAKVGEEAFRLLRNEITLALVPIAEFIVNNKDLIGVFVKAAEILALVSFRNVLVAGTTKLIGIAALTAAGDDTKATSIFLINSKNRQLAAAAELATSKAAMDAQVALAALYVNPSDKTGKAYTSAEGALAAAQANEQAAKQRLTLAGQVASHGKAILGAATAGLGAILANPWVAAAAIIATVFKPEIEAITLWSAETLNDLFNTEASQALKRAEAYQNSIARTPPEVLAEQARTKAAKEFAVIVEDALLANALAAATYKTQTIELQRQLEIRKETARINALILTDEEKAKLISIAKAGANQKAEKDLNELRKADEKEFSDIIAKQEIDAAYGVNKKILELNKDITDYRLGQEKIYGIDSKQTNDNVIKYSRLKWKEFRNEQIEEEKQFNLKIFDERATALDDVLSKEIEMQKRIKEIRSSALKPDTYLSRGFYESDLSFEGRSIDAKYGSADYQQKLQADAAAEAERFVPDNGEAEIDLIQRRAEAYSKFYAEKQRLAEKDRETEKANLASKLDNDDKFSKESLSNQVSYFASSAEMFKDRNMEGFDFWKALKITEATISGIDAGLKSFAFGASWGGPAGGAAMASLSAAFTLAQIAAIESTTFQGKKLGGNVAGGQPIIVGDGGKPEVFTPYTNGSISQLPNSTNSSPTIVQPIYNITVNPGGSFDKQVLNVLNAKHKELFGVVREANRRFLPA